MKCPTSGARTKSVLYHRFRWSRLITSNRGSIKVGQATIIAESTVWHAFGPYTLSPLFSKPISSKKKKTGQDKSIGIGTRAVAALRRQCEKKAEKARRRLKGAKAPPFFQEPF